MKMCLCCLGTLLNHLDQSNAATRADIWLTLESRKHAYGAYDCGIITSVHASSNKTNSTMPTQGASVTCDGSAVPTTNNTNSAEQNPDTHET